MSDCLSASQAMPGCFGLLQLVNGCLALRSRRLQADCAKASSTPMNLADLEACRPPDTDKLCGMRRCLLIALLCFLPVQFSWAAVAGYCQHESSPAAAHAGHHEHTFSASADTPHAGPEAAEAMGQPLSAEAEADQECGHCCGHLCALPLMLADAHVSAGQLGPQWALQAQGTSHAQLRPERPQWPSLA